LYFNYFFNQVIVLILKLLLKSNLPNTAVTYVQNVHLWLKHKLASVLAIGQLYCQSATAPGCTTQLQDVCGLPLFVRRSSKPVSCTFLDKFFIPLHFRFLSGNWRISCQAPYPFELHKFL